MMLPRLATRRRSLVNFIRKRYLANFSDRFDKHIPPKLKPLWHHPTGPKTIFFWAPIFKMGLLVAALGDLNRDPKDLSLPQTISLFLNGIFCGRFAMVIEPKNYVYLTANISIGLVQGPKTIFFWAPVFKMGLLVAAFGDMHRNTDDISIPQTISLMLNGTLSCRYAMVIEPRNYVYLLSNFLLAVVQSNQLRRALSNKNRSPTE